tara:strand:+ start:82 stop:606 length:525 start_codon:yes stop_codon:yes gene_type:complete
MIENTRLANTWPWQNAWITFAFWIPGLSGLLLTYFAYPLIGKIAYWLLSINAWGLLFAIVYSYVNKRVFQRKKSLKDKGLEPFDGLVSFGKIQAPSAIALSKDTIYFAPIVGKELFYDLNMLKKVEMKTSIPGKNFFFKVAFHLTLENDAIFAFAVNIANAQKIKRQLMPELVT